MTAKITASRRRAFLTHLANTGNVTLSAERAKVSRSWVMLHRNEDPAFDEACREALAVAKMMLVDDAKAPLDTLGRNGSGRKPAHPHWVRHEGHELVVSGTNGRRTQVRRARLLQWSPKVEDHFLAVLAATCNVKAACREVGMHPPSAYNHRKRWPGFAMRWDQAIELGMRELEAQALQNIGYYFDRDLPPPEAPMKDITVMDAIRLMRMYEKRERRK